GVPDGGRTALDATRSRRNTDELDATRAATHKGPLPEGAPGSPDARSLRRAIDLGTASPRHVISYQRAVGNQAMQRLLSERVQRDYLIPEYQDVASHFF